MKIVIAAVEMAILFCIQHLSIYQHVFLSYVYSVLQNPVSHLQILAMLFKGKSNSLIFPFNVLIIPCFRTEPAYFQINL